MDYQTALKYLDSRIIFGINPGLERIRELSRKLNNPHLSYPVIQITGSNGKSSAARMVSALLVEHGFKVGTYTSPHLHSYTERITINSKYISEKDFANSLEELIPFVEGVNQNSKEPLTHFEILTALAFLYFHRKEIEVGVVEVGMGGRWDATSIVSPKVAMITNVELEHTDRLGTTIKGIAWEKAHIIKECSQAVVGPLKREALEVAKERCGRLGIGLILYGEDFYPLSYSLDEGYQEVSVQGLSGRYEGLNLPLLGKHQTENLALALAAAEVFTGRALELPKVKKALFKLDFPGRMEKVRRGDRVIILDGAHNPAGAASLAKALRENFSWDRLFLILAIFKDKSIKQVLEELVPLAFLTILSENGNERRAPVELLQKETRELTSNYISEPNLSRALALALEKAQSNDLVLVTGSLYTVAEAREHLSLQPPVLSQINSF